VKGGRIHDPLVNFCFSPESGPFPGFSPGPGLFSGKGHKTDPFSVSGGCEVLYVIGLRVRFRPAARGAVNDDVAAVAEGVRGDVCDGGGNDDQLQAPAAGKRLAADGFAARGNHDLLGEVQ